MRLTSDTSIYVKMWLVPLRYVVEDILEPVAWAVLVFCSVVPFLFEYLEEAREEL